MVGKRGKERSAEGEEAKALGPASADDTDLHTVFVRSLPFSLNDSQLEDIFSEVGPVRHCFTIKEKGSDQHRGFGFVQFAVTEDAHRAVQEKNGALVQGRKIKVEIAKRRAPLDKRRPPKPDPPNTESTDSEQQQDPKLDAAKAEPKKRKSSELQITSPADKSSTEQRESKKIKPGGQAKFKVQQAEQKKEEEVSPAREDQKKEGKMNKPDGKPQAAVKDGETKEQEDVKGSAKQRPARTVVVGGLLNTEMFEAVLSVAKTVGVVESVQRTFSEHELTSRGLAKDGCKPRAAAIVFLSVKAAMQAVAALHTKTIGGGAVWARQLGGEGSKLKNLRLIVRNLPFQVTETQLRELFSPVGFLWEVTIPRKPDGMCKGFAFVGFTNKSDAEKAIKAVNGKSIGNRPIAVDWAVAKKQYEAVVSTAKTAGPAAGIPDLDDGDTTASDSEDEVEEAETEDEDEPEAPIVEKQVTAKADRKSKKSKLPIEDETAIEEEDEETPLVEKKSKKKNLAREEAALEKEDDAEIIVDEKKKKKKSKRVREEEEKKKESQLENMDRSEEMETMKKILNKVVSSTQKQSDSPAIDDDDNEEDETPVSRKGKGQGKGQGHPSKMEALQAVEAYGKLSKAKKAMEPVVPEKDEDKSNIGRTLFIRNLPPDAKVPELRKMFSDFGVVKSLRMVLQPITLRPKGTAFLEYATKEAAEAAIAAASTNGVDRNGLMVKGRVINVTLAVDRDTARDIAKDASKKKDQEDRRNLALAKEGFIQEGTPAAEDVSKKDLQKRQMLEYEKSTKLRSPNFHVSRTRLSVHNLPKGMTEKALKKLFIEAVKSRASKQHPVIKQVKILRDEETGKARGTAFVEFTEHQHALVALRVLNNNPATFTAESRPIVEFAVENSLILRKRAVQLEKAKSMQVGQKSENVDKVDDREELAGKTKKGRKSRRDEPERKGEKGGEVERGETPTTAGVKKKGKGKKNGKDRVVESGSVSEDQSPSTAGRKRKRERKDEGNRKTGDGGVDSKVSNQAGQGRPTKTGTAVQNGRRDGTVMKDKPATTAVNGRPPKSHQAKIAASKPGQIAKRGPAKKLAAQKSREMDEASLREKKRQKKLSKAVAAEDKLDKLVKEYRTKYFAEAPTSKGKTKSTGGTLVTAGDLRRWFE